MYGNSASITNISSFKSKRRLSHCWFVWLFLYRYLCTPESPAAGVSWNVHSLPWSYRQWGQAVWGSRQSDSGGLSVWLQGYLCIPHPRDTWAHNRRVVICEAGACCHRPDIPWSLAIAVWVYPSFILLFTGVSIWKGLPAAQATHLCNAEEPFPDRFISIAGEKRHFQEDSETFEVNIPLANNLYSHYSKADHIHVRPW